MMRVHNIMCANAITSRNYLIIVYIYIYVCMYTIISIHISVFRALFSNRCFPRTRANNAIITYKFENIII